MRLGGKCILQTKFLNASENGISEAADILKSGGLVGIPTETVYGLAANALNGEAVSKIFKAKGRPQDNPLIVHICDIEEIYKLTSDFPKKAKMLAEKFWPGPLTIILPKSDLIPNEVSAFLKTVAIRMPSHKLARAIIKKSGIPLAAPSANTSGSPSPTTAEHVLKDMDGKIDAIIDGGKCEVGVESTVITLVGEKPRLLRPGGITKEQIESVIGNIDVDQAVLEKISDIKEVASPGMKYKHYAPKARVILLKGDGYKDYVNSNLDESVAALCYDEDLKDLKCKAFSIGNKGDYKTQARNLFNILRKFDDDDQIKIVYARCPEPNGVGMAVYNRLIRAAGFEVKDT